MEDINALYKALEQADAVGDKESAQELANYIRTLPTQEPTVEQPIVDVTQPPTIKPPAIKSVAPIDVMGQQFTPDDYAKYSGMPIATKPGEQAKGEFSGNFGTSLYNLAAQLALAQGKVTGTYKEAEETAKRLREYGEKTYTAADTTWKEDPIAKIQQLAGGSAPYMIAPIAAAMASSGIGLTGLAASVAPFLTATGQFVGSNLERQMGTGKTLEETSLSKALPAAAFQGALDQIGLRYFPFVKNLFKAGGKEITDEAAKQIVQKSLVRKVGDKVIDVHKGMVIEGGTEAGQQFVERLQAGLDLTSPQAMQEYFDSFIGGYALTGAMGVSGNVIEGIANKVIPEQKEIVKEKEPEPEPDATEQRPSRETLKKEFLAQLEAEANQVNQAKADAEAQLKSAQTKQVVTEATDLESMAPVNPTELTDTTLTSWGLSKNSKPYKTLIGQDAGTPEGRALIDTALESYMGKINEPAVDTYKSLLDQQKVEADNGPRIDAGQGVDTGTIGIDNEVLGQPKYGTPGTVAGYNEPTVNISGTPTTLTETREADVNAPLEAVAPVVEEAPVEEVAPVSTQPKLASQLRALDSTNPLIEALQFDQASEEEVAVAQDTIQELQTSRKAKRADLTKVSEEEKDIPLEARGEIQNTGETPDTIEGAFQQQYGKNVRLAKQRGLLNFLNDVSELPKEVGPVTPGTKAVYHKGKGYFITNRITKEDAPRMLLHEIGVHYGLEGMLGTTNYKRVVKQIKQNHLTDKELKASWDNTLKTYPEYPEGSNNFMQEVIANIGETAPNNSIFRQIVGYIKQFLSKLGYGWNVNNITADDIRDMVQQSVRMSLAGKIKGTQPGITMKGEEKVGMQKGFAITSAMRDKAMAGQPLFARMSEQELDRQLAAAGNKRAPKVQPPSFKDNLMAHPLQTVGDMVRNFRKAAFSFDFAINQKIMAAMRKAGVSVEEIARSFYQMQISQAVKSDQIADLFMIHGNIKYDPNSFKFVVSDVKDSMTSIRDKLTSLAKKYGVSETKMYEYASAAFIARRSQGLNAANIALKKRVLKLMVAGKTSQARTQMDRNYKLVHLTAAEIKAGEKFFTDFKDSNGKSELEKLFKSWNKNRARVLSFAKDQGLYSEEDIEDLLDVMDYVPFFRDAQIEAGKGPKEYARGLLDAAADKRLKGSYQPVNNVFDNMERWTRYTIRKSVNNRAAQEKIRLYSQWVPDDIKILRGKERPKSGNIVNVWQNGKLVKYEFEGTDGASMVDGFTGLEPVMIPFLNGTLRPVSNFLRLNIVLQPVFSIAQIPMDIYNSMFTSQVRFPLAVPLQAIKEIMLTPFGMSAARNYLKTTGTVGKHDFSSEYDRIDIDAMNELKKAGSLTKLVKLITHPLGVLAMASDNVIRQAVYSQVMLETKDQARAVHMAEEIINFRRTGSSGVVNIMRQNAPFVNANLQSIHIALSTLVDSGIGPDTYGKAFKRLVTTGSQMFILAMLYAVLNADDDDYKKADPLEKDRYLFIPGSNGFKLPLRNDIITLIFKTLPEHLVNRFIMESEDSTKLLNALQVGLTRALALPSGIPTLISPLIEANYNIDSNTGRPIIGRGQENLEEDLQYSNKYTTQLSRMMGEASGTSPAMIQHFFNRYFGTTSLLLGMVTNGLVAAMRGEILPEKTVRDYLLQIPSMGSFVAKEHGSRNINDYYELNEIVTKIVASAKRYEKLDYPKYQEYISKDNRAEIINMQKEMAAISKELQVLRDYENKIYASKDANRWTPATKKAELDRLEGIRQNMLGSQLKLKERSDRYIQQLRYRGGL